MDNKHTRRQLGAAALAVGGVTLASTAANAHDASQNNAPQGGIDANTLNTLANVVNSAKTPEEAYKVFMSLIGPAILNGIASSVAQAVDQTKTTTNGNSAISGWQNLVTGCSMNMVWGGPFRQAGLAATNSVGDYFNQISPTVLSAVSDAKVASTNGGSISVSGSWSF